MRVSKRSALGVLLAVLAATNAGPAFAQAGDLRAVEQRFDVEISASDQLSWLKEMASAPNHVGSRHNRANAEMQLALFRAWGWDARIETFEIFYPTPISTRLELIGKEPLLLGAQEPAVPGDKSTSHLAGALPPYVAYQGDGDVTAPVVYVNYGMPEDYEALAQRGIEIKGKIVLARYGGGWRGLKPKLAQEHGAVGCLIYSDPAEDGFAKGDVYPKGGARPPEGVQRGSVLDMTIYPGDPLTPGSGSTPEANRLAPADAMVILKIPALPISYGDAAKILARLEGPVVTGRARGGLAMAYHWGGTDAAMVRLQVQSDWSQKTIYNVIAVMRGRTRPDEWIIRGNHRDAWVFGASDPLSGQVALMSEAKALGALAGKGWHPDRTLVYASWDGEEAGLLGSTEWAETHAEELKAKAVMYINTDSSGRGFLNVDGSHIFQHFVNEAARDVTDPQTGVSVLDRLRARARLNVGSGASSLADGAAAASADMPIDPLGSGSDYAAFIHHLGIPSLNVGFGGEGSGGGSYHSAYDSFLHFTMFDDPGKAYGPALSKLVGRLVLRASAEPVVTARYGDFAAVVSRYLKEVQTLAAEQRKADLKLQDMVRDRVFELTSNAGDPTRAPAIAATTPEIDMVPLEAAAARLSRSAAAADAAAERERGLPDARRGGFAASLAGIDQLLLDRGGLPGRPWYRNLIYAPGTLTGYGAKTLPAVREAIEQRRFDDARTYVDRTAAALNAYSDRLDEAAKLAE